MAYSQTIRINLDTRGLSRLRSLADPRAEKVLDIAASTIEKGWKDNIVAKHVIDTGNYLNSVHVEGDHRPLERVISDGTDYGIFQEMGTTKMGARPCVTPAVEMERPRLQAAWRELFK